MKTPTKGERAYLQRSEQHQPWDAIARSLDTSDTSCIAVARKYAKKRDLAWPIKVPTLSPLLEPEKHTVAAWAYEEAKTRPSRRRWHKLAEETGNTIEADGGKLQYLAEQYARDNALAWPPPSNVASLGEQAYTTAATGVLWPEVAEVIGFDHVPNAIESARRWAEKNDLDWPLFRKRAA